MRCKYVQQRALIQFLLTDGPTHRRTPKRNGPKVVFIIPSARREDELRDEKIAGYLAAPRGSTSAPSRSTSRPRRNQGSQTQTTPATRRAENQSTPATRCLSPSLERCVFPSELQQILTLDQILTLWQIPSLFRSLDSLARRPFYRYQARFAPRDPLSGAVRSGVARSRARSKRTDS